MTKAELVEKITKFEEYKFEQPSKLMKKLKAELETLLVLLENKPTKINYIKEKHNIVNFLTDDEKLEFNYYLEKNLEQLRPDQQEMIDFMIENYKGNICYPTASGKGFIMINDLLRRIIRTDESILAVVSHSLTLNSQHLDDIFDKTLYLTGKIGYIFVGSCDYTIPYTHKKHKNNGVFETLMTEFKINTNDIIYSTTIESDVSLLVNKHLSNNRKVVIISTYNSLDKLKSLNINTIYYDEAHKLANDKSETSDTQNKFEKNYKVINSTNRFFFTATPKDESYCEDEESNNFLMNNKEIFGERVGLTFKKAIEINAILRPSIHISKPIKIEGDDDYNSIPNKTKFLIDSYEFHRGYQKSISISPEKIDGKVLVKCCGLEEVWSITKLLVDNTTYNVVAAGSSSAADKGILGLSDKQRYSRINGIVFETNDRSEFLEKIKNVKLNENLIILHDDIFTEGINIPGITATMFLGDTLPNLIKILQNTGRANRKSEEDTKDLKEGKIDKLENNMCLKPGCSVIIPYWDSNSQENSEKIEKTIKKLVLNCDWGVLEVPLGTEKSFGSSEDELDLLNNDFKISKSKNKLGEIENIIKIIEDEKRTRFINSLSKMETIRLNNMPHIDRENYIKEKIS